ncbi:ACT domain-containing protein [Demequina sp. SYSU T00068]|uniref:ACT domain-containing protein n=1 Tax=Demequina lignilytica TaxID=3051663 RepID=UPI00261A4B42|nr:ACT domain-containing protein [Demequina sp. SYSU T00068]MDN4490067.1 ACT domain-containing protein [Demequina sp. SYSU T00068]
MTAVSTRWFAFVEVDDRAGASSALTGVFSERGVSFASISTLDVHDGRGTVCVEFTASERLAHVLVRTLERLAVVRAVVLIRADDAGVGAVAVLTGVVGDVEAGPGVTVHSHAEGGAPITMLAGPLTDVRATMADLRGRGAVVEALTVLPPR